MTIVTGNIQYPMVTIENIKAVIAPIEDIQEATVLIWNIQEAVVTIGTYKMLLSLYVTCRGLWSL